MGTDGLSRERRPPAGFGLAVTGAAEEATRLASARAVGLLLKGEEIPEPAEETLEAFSVCKGMFNRVLRQDQPDWLTTQVRLGYPSGERCGRIGHALGGCRTAIKKGDATGWAMARLVTRRERTRRALLAYRGRRALDAVPGSGFVYVMSRREDPDLLVVGATPRPLLDEAALVNADRPSAPLGVRWFWWVTDVAAATAVVGDVTGGPEDDPSGEYRADYRRIRGALARGLEGEGIVMDAFSSLKKVGSPDATRA